jgi:hypothetical protein
VGNSSSSGGCSGACTNGGEQASTGGSGELF